MPPRMRIVEKKVGDEECRARRPPHRRLLERPPADEDAAGRGLDESKVAMHGCWGTGLLGYLVAGYLVARLYDRPVSRPATQQPSNPATDPATIQKMFASIAPKYDRA